MVIRNWKNYRPSSMQDAIRACKDFALEKKRLSVSGICTLLATNEDTLYKWMSTGRMPVCVVPQFEMVCGTHFVSDFLSASAGRLVLPMPKGRKPTDAELMAVNSNWANAMTGLAKFYADPTSVDTTVLLSQLRGHLEEVTFHHTNVARFEQPELGLEVEP